jgi:hypothetical protein
MSNATKLSFCHRIGVEIARWSTNVICVFLAVATFSVTANGQETSHYPPGAEGIKGSSIPGPGQYLKWYNIAINADDLKDNRGNDVPAGFDVSVFVTAPRLIWITEQKFLGADYGWDVLVPLVHANVEVGAAGIDTNDTGIGDIYVEPLLLGWHQERLDVVAAAGVWTPNGPTSGPAAAGKGFWTGMFTLGATTWLDDEKLWSVSALSRYETNSTKRQADVRPGDDFHIEWGLARNFGGVLDIGASGYAHWQVTDDRGTAAVNPSQHDRFFSIGPEINYFHKDSGLFFQLRYQFDFAARNRPEGRNLVFSFVKVLEPGMFDFHKSDFLDSRY